MSPGSKHFSIFLVAASLEAQPGVTAHGQAVPLRAVGSVATRGQQRAGTAG